MKRLACFLILYFSFSQTLFADENYKLQKLFSEANDSYTAGQYEDAIQKYEDALKVQTNGILYFNLANSYFRTNSIGKSIFYYNKAKIFMPRGPDVGFNLNYARSKAQDKIEKKSGVETIILSIARLLNERESFYFLFISSFLFLGTSIFLIYRKHASLIALRYVFGLFLVVGITFVFVNSFMENSFGVVIAKEAKVLSGPGAENIILFTLHEGSEFTISDSWKDSWSQIQLADKKKGWIQNSDIIF